MHLNGNGSKYPRQVVQMRCKREKSIAKEATYVQQRSRISFGILFLKQSKAKCSLTANELAFKQPNGAIEMINSYQNSGSKMTLCTGIIAPEKPLIIQNSKINGA